MVDKIKMAVAVALVIAGVWGYYHFSETAQVLRVLMVLGGLIAAGAVAWLTAPGKELFIFLAGSVAGSKQGVVAHAQGNGSNDAGRLRFRRGHGALPVRGRYVARVAGQPHHRSGEA